MFASVLIANRGEIACRIIRTARRLGLRTIAVYSDADADAPHVRQADQAFRIGPPEPLRSYLDIAALIAVTRESGAECVHPGYGFLSERAEFAEACEAAGITFVGPPANAIRAMGLKDAAKSLMERAGVPVVPGYHGEIQDPKFLREKAYEIGYPVLIKAVAGGGGKGMRRVNKHADFDAALEGAQREAQSAFGEARILIEKYVAQPRHIEIQVFADAHGNAVHLNERDCSLQRRHQKVIEEAPAPGMSEELRAQMGAAAVKAAQAVGYVGAGTVEFIADASSGLRPDGFWFMEMNTRLQVEHPVTEMITGYDLVEWQFRVAAGETLPVSQADIRIDGHAVEARVYAEDPSRDFMPSTGKLWRLRLPEGEGIRVDSGVEEGGMVTPFYDPMIAKVIAHAPTRDDALHRLEEALERTIVAGPRTNVAFLAELCRLDAFRSGRFDTGTIAEHQQASEGTSGLDHAAAAAGIAHLVRRELAQARSRASVLTNEPASSWASSDGWSLGPATPRSVAAAADGEAVRAAVTFVGGDVHVSVAGTAAAAHADLVDTDDGVLVLHRGRQTVVRMPDVADHAADESGAGGAIVAPLHGRILAIHVEKGEAVSRGQRLAVLEAMKMEHAIAAPADALVAEIFVTEGAQVAEGERLIGLEAAAGLSAEM